MTEKDKNDIADIVMRKMLAARKSMSKGLDNLNDVLFTLINTDLTEEELLVSELARLMTLMNVLEEKEEYEKAAVLKNKVEKIEDKLDHIENERRKNGDM
jgi:predicted transcriptional regulator